MRALQGIFPVLKPTGITSSKVLEQIKSNLGYRPKMGHGGTLDKSAKGVLVVGINSGCTKLPVFLDGDKAYRFTCQFGRATDTYCANGKVTMEKSFDHITQTKIIAAIQPLVGRILQKPPPFSALKKGGKRLSDLVMEGVIVDPDPRWVQCDDLSVLNFDPPHLTMQLVCGRGFYVRSLVHDLAISLNSCAHVTELERIRQGPFTTELCLKEDQWTEESIQKGIERCRVLVHEYMDVQMEKYRRNHDLPSLRKRPIRPQRPSAEQWVMRE